MWYLKKRERKGRGEEGRERRREGGREEGGKRERREEHSRKVKQNLGNERKRGEYTYL